MSYKINDDKRIKDDNTAVFSNIIVGTIQREFGTQTLSKGFVSGGQDGSATNQTAIDTFSFASDGNASATGGNLSLAVTAASGNSSGSHGYSSGGAAVGTPGYVDNIQKFPFAITSGTASDIGNLILKRNNGIGVSDGGSGYTVGGFGPGIFGQYPPQNNSFRTNIDKFSFAADGNAAEVGELSAAKRLTAGAQSQTHGFIAGGASTATVPSNTQKDILKFAFASPGTTSDVGDLTQLVDGSAGQTSTTHGYRSGGTQSPNTITNVIDKFPFAISGGTATDVGDLTQARNSITPSYSNNHGYSSSGLPISNIIDKFPFSSDANATDVGDLTATKRSMAGQQG